MFVAFSKKKKRSIREKKLKVMQSKEQKKKKKEHNTNLYVPCQVESIAFSSHRFIVIIPLFSHSQIKKCNALTDDYTSCQIKLKIKNKIKKIKNESNFLL
ncbi:hypothetical protein RFI_17271 [Reticulomyxa filosa]|uniref:Uncharacterized protein n=1 Tax=Reticulomyxa filosa TaxID=46433 RepID=X6N112_RETFI|nr:hypothetical protein RFI_17271 [Reticulomyxa filosa]|eukprot:ETO19950.1 hypothetical protein RFI_17271 [Reticulomyxa filosa]